MSKKTVRLLLCLFALVFAVNADAQNKKTVTGTVTDSTGQAISGVSIILPDGKTVGVTDDRGTFTVSVPEEVKVLQLKHVSYAPKSVAIGDDGKVVATLSSNNGNMDEVVVTTSMGIKRQTRSLGYAVSTITSKQLTETGATNFASALYGKAAGVRVTSAPGGASSGVSIQLRGVTSIGLNTQPLYVVNGVPIRNFSDPTSSSFGTSSSRVDGNGILDINPEDIESITILKGASATALYGSEAANGVVVITTKKGAIRKGLGVDFNYTFNTERLAQSPDYQNEYGPGYDAQTNVGSFGATYDGWLTQSDGNVTPIYRAYASFGPKFDGREVVDWDGTTRKYLAQKNNYRDFFDNGYNSNANVAVSGGSENGSFRLSYNRMDYKGIMPGSKQSKNNFNFNGSLKLSDRVSVDLVSSYNNTFTHNRAMVTSTIFGSYSGFFSRFDDMNTYKTKYQTSLGYKYLTYSNTEYDTDENFLYNMRATQLLDYFWTNEKNKYDESQNRFINTLTVNVKVLNNLNFRAKIGDDYTSINNTTKEANTKPSYLGYTGYYGVTSNSYNVIYGDGLLTYTPKINHDFELGVNAGVTGRKQMFKYMTTNTGSSNGLVEENYFSLSNSSGTLTATATRAEQVDVAAFGMVNANYKQVLYLEGTGRYEATSTLAPENNSYFYPSVNAGFILSDVVKLPSLFNYAKIRASYGLVGNHPNAYQSNVAYNQNSVVVNDNTVIYQQANSSSFGNESLQSEKKRETEFGLETRLLNNRIGIDLSYYNNKISRMIIPSQTIAASTGATSAIVNAGNLLNYGFEAAINVAAIKTRDFSWTTNFNFAINKNKVLAIYNGLTELVNTTYDGGYITVKSKVGDPLGNIYTYKRKTDGNGNYVIDDDGFYTINTDTLKYVANGMPKLVGGWSNTFRYKAFSLDIILDYKLGGYMISTARYYQTGAGMFKSTLQYRDAAHGGMAYDATSDEDAEYVLNSGGSRHDGMVLTGVTSTGATNTKVITAAAYYLANYEWEGRGMYENAIFRNSYIKFRELALNYNLPKNIARKIKMQNVQFSLIGRNLFYLWKTLPQGMDPEAPVGSTWLDQMSEGGGTAAATRSLGFSLKAQF
ncbi:MAG: SusC/RagA family TonB-linked outer membrane protein [Chitinophagaceae bacterium]